MALLLRHYLGIYDGHSPITLLITIFRTAVSSGNRTQIGINSVCNHRIDQRRLFLSIPFVGENNYLYQKKGKLNRSTSCFADVNECATGKHNCNGSSICHNTKGSFRCICREPGYFWNGVKCTGKYLLYIEIVYSSDKKGRCAIAVCHMMKSFSLSLSLISRLFPLSRVQLFKNKQTKEKGLWNSLGFNLLKAHDVLA